MRVKPRKRLAYLERLETMTAQALRQSGHGLRLLVCGFGKLGSVVAASAEINRKTLIVERNPVRATQARNRRFHVLEADLSDPAVIATIKATDIAICIQGTIGLHLLKQFRQSLPHARIRAACPDWSVAEEYMKAGAFEVAVLSWIAGQGLAATVPG